MSNNRKKFTAADIRAAENFSTNPLPARDPEDLEGKDFSVIELSVLDVDAYEGNPRKQVNPEYDAIYESILAIGLQQRLTVTRKPGSKKYFLSKGGKTRLSILHALATHSDPDIAKRFQTMIFDNEAYVNESKLLAAHMVENKKRGAMCFWDEAVAIGKMRNQLEAEQGKKSSAREYSAELEKLGLKTSHALLSVYTFAVEFLSYLDEMCAHLARVHVEIQLRPLFTDLSILWQKHPNRSKSDFETHFKSTVGLYVGTAIVTGYNVAHLVTYIKDKTGEALGYTGETKHQLDILLEGQERFPKAPLSELLAPPPVESSDAEATASAGSAGANADTDGHADAGLAALAAMLAGNKGASTTADDAAESPYDSGSPFDDDDADSDASTSSAQAAYNNMFGGGRSDSMAGVRVATGLIPKTYKNSGAAAVGAADATAAALADAAGTDTSQMGFEGMNPLDAAFRRLDQDIAALGELTGTAYLITKANLMPLGYFMEMPDVGVLGGREDLPMRAWWFLANVSGQNDTDATGFLTMLNNVYIVDGVEHPLIPDTGEFGFRQVTVDDTKWSHAVTHRLGGSMQDQASFMVALLTEPGSELAEPCLRILNSLRAFKQALLVERTAASHGTAA